MGPRLLQFEMAWIDAACDAIYPDDSALPHGVQRMHPGEFFAHLVAGAPLEQALGLRLAVWIVALAPVLVLGRVATIGSRSLTREERGRIVARLLASQVYAVRQLTLSLKAMTSLLYARSPAVRTAMLAGAGGDHHGSALVALRTRRPSTKAVPHDDPRDHAAE